MAAFSGWGLLGKDRPFCLPPSLFWVGWSCQPLPPAPPGFPGATWEGFCPPGIHIRPSVRFGPSPWRPMRNPNRSHPNVRCACVHVSGVVTGSMGEIWGAGISGGSGEDRVAGAAGYWIPDQVRDDVGWGGKALRTLPQRVIPGEDPGSSMLGGAGRTQALRQEPPSPLEGRGLGVRGAQKLSAPSFDRFAGPAIRA